jgi:hypothetical protein
VTPPRSTGCFPFLLYAFPTPSASDLHRLLSSNMASSSRASCSSMEEDSHFPTRAAFEREMNKYLAGLGEKKARKALGSSSFSSSTPLLPLLTPSRLIVTPALFALISAVLRHPHSTSNGTAQERHWIKREFSLADPNDLNSEILHSKKGWRGPLPRLARKGEIYDVVKAEHERLNHRGRDKTFALVKKLYSHIPKGTFSRAFPPLPSLSLEYL